MRGRAPCGGGAWLEEIATTRERPKIAFRPSLHRIRHQSPLCLEPRLSAQNRLSRSRVFKSNKGTIGNHHLVHGENT